MRTFLICFLSLLLALPGAAKPSPLPPPVVPQCVGVNIHFTGQPQRDLDGLESVGVGWVRMDFAWSDVEKAQGVYDFSEYDSLLQGLTARHIRPLFILDYGNDLYQPGPPTTPEARAAFARFVSAAATHYRDRGILWELWNEPNGNFWPPHPNAQQYGALALAAAHAIHAADPTANVVGPASSGIPVDFLEALFKQGLLAELDAVSVHPYRSGEPESVFADDLALRSLISRYAPPGKDIPLLWSEWGYTTLSVNETQQAQYLTREWLSGLADGVRLSIWYDWHDDGVNPLDPEDHFGMVHADYSPKPAYIAARTLTQTLGGCRFIKRVPLASPDDYLLLFAAPQGTVRLAVWTSGAPHDILLPISHIAAMVGMTGGDLMPTVDHGRLRLPLSGNPVYLDVPDDAALHQAIAWAALPSDPFYADSSPLQWSVSYRNPDKVTHRVRFQALMMTAGGGRTPISGGTDNVGPGQTLRLGMASSAMARAPVQIRVGLSVDNVLQPYPQDLTFTPTDPVTLIVSVLSQGAVRVDIANLSGKAFTGTLSGAGAAPLSVHLAAGQTALSLTLTADDRSVWRLTDVKGHLVAVATGADSRRP